MRVVKRINALVLTGLALWLIGTSIAGAAEVNVYSARHYPSDQAIYDQFSKDTGIKVNVVEGDVNGLSQRLQREGTASPADLFITVDAANLQRVKAKDLTQPIESATVNEVVPANLRDADNHWTTISLRARVIAYAIAKVKPDEIKAYEDLADAKWKGKVLARTSNHPYNVGLIASLIAANGPEKTEDWAKAVTGNMARKPQGGDVDQLAALAVGEGAVALTNTYYYARLKGSDKAEDRAIADKVGLIFPNQDGRGVHVNVSGVALTKGSPNKANAIKFIDYLLSPTAQEAMATKGTSEFPVRAGVPQPAGLPALSTLKVDPLPLTKLGELQADAVKLADRAGWR
ncbi:extracellular solute-binding protein [Lacibacterium aquatile]|uniref:Extracellular solute-binding protein n=1 Tax=Lacibacterium aquatile TaxID=1168082 RepID=A0ABW5DUK9_9PROT